jgi:hypothetical protein
MLAMHRGPNTLVCYQGYTELQGEEAQLQTYVTASQRWWGCLVTRSLKLRACNPLCPFHRTICVPPLNPVCPSTEPLVSLT